MDWPSLSVIIPSYNQGAYIERTLLSILKQEYPGPLQVIVSDGGSTDETVEVLKKYPQVQWWSERDAGFVDAVTKGLAAATGEFVAIQSSDDFYLEGAFVKAVAVLRQEPDLLFVTGNEIRVSESGDPLYATPMPFVTLTGPGALIGRAAVYVPQHCTFIRRSAVDRVGGLRADVDMCADFDLWYRLLHFGHALLLPDYLAVYQMHATQRSQNKADLWLRALKKVVEDAEHDPIYEGRYRPTPQNKRSTFLLWDITWNLAAGGEEGREKSRALADEALAQGGAWPDYVRDFIQGYATKQPPEPPPPQPSRLERLTHGLQLKLKQNTAIRKMFGRTPLPPPEPDQEPNEEVIESIVERLIEETVDLDWWQEPTAFKTATE